MRIVFFDGYCNLCNQWVDFLLKRTARESIHFASQQGETASRLLGLKGQVSEGIVFLDGQAVYRDSDAVLRIFHYYPVPWSWLWVLRFIPRGFRDLIYRFLARHRYVWFGKRNACRLPTAEEKNRFLD